MRTSPFNTVLTLFIFVFISIYFIYKPAKPVFKHARLTTVETAQATIFDYSNVNTTKEKKRIFFQTLRPIVEHQNQLIHNLRLHVLFAKQYDTDHTWLFNIANQYKIDWNPQKPDWNLLLSRIDTIPAELVMAQAANESAWGQSRFSQQGNNLFGQWCLYRGCGLVPKQRDDGAIHEVKKFSSINESVSSYMHNINTAKAYKELRQSRVELRSAEKPLDATILAKGLEKYSSRGKAYVNEIQSMIKTNF